MYDFKHYLPKAEIKGIDISKYCKKNALPSVKKNIKLVHVKNYLIKKVTLTFYFDFKNS